MKYLAALMVIGSVFAGNRSEAGDWVTYEGKDGPGRDQERVIPLYPDAVDPGVGDDEDGAVLREVRRGL